MVLRLGAKSVPKGFLAVTVGQWNQEQKRFVIPVKYVNHPLFMRLLKEVEEECEFGHKSGPIHVPCDVDEFSHVIGLIQDSEKTTKSNHLPVPTGSFLAVTVGQGDEQKKPFVIPVNYVNHPLFVRLLKVAEEEYGFDQNGPIHIPCHVDEFCRVKGLIQDMEQTAANHHHRRRHFLGFKACLIH